MSIEFFWRIPTNGDGRESLNSRGDWSKGAFLAPGRRHGQPDGLGYVDYASQVARAADISGFDGALIPTGRGSDEPWVLASALARETHNLRLLVAFQPGFIHPAYAVQMGATLSRISNGRVDWNIITGGDSKAQRAYGDFNDHAARYARTREYLEVVKGYRAGAPYDFKGDLYQFEDSGLAAPLKHARPPAIYFGGSSAPALDVAANFADVYLMWSEPLEQVRDEIARVRAAAEAAGRGEQLRFGIRVDVIARDTEEEAWNEVRKLYASVPEQQKQQFREVGPRDEGVGVQRQWALHGGKVDRFEDLIIAPNLWAGMALAKGGGSTTAKIGGPTCVLVGSHQQIAERLLEYIGLGVSTFILAAKPHLEEAYRVGENVLPVVRAALDDDVRRAAS